MDYDAVLEQALKQTLDDYEGGRVRLHFERDLQGYLYHKCIVQLERERHPPPFPVLLEVDDLDLVLGPGAQTAVELKFEPYRKPQGVVFLWEKDGPNSVEKDLKKLRRFAVAGRSAHFIMIEATPDEDYWFPSRTAALGIPEKEWRRRRGFVWIHHQVAGK